MSIPPTTGARKRIAPVLLTLLLAASLVAGAGVGVTPAAAEPTAVTDCLTVTQPGVYEVRSDLTADGSACIRIRASDVTVRGNGHSVDAKSGFGAEPVVLAGVEGGDLANVTVTGLSVSVGPRSALRYEGVSNGTVADLAVDLVDPSGPGGWVTVDGDRTVVRNVTGARVAVIGDGNRVVDSSALGAEYAGVTVTGDRNAVVNVTSDGRPALSVVGDRNRVRGGSFEGVIDGDGVELLGGEANSVSDAAVRAGPADGRALVLVNAADTAVRNNTVRGDLVVGLSVEGSRGTVIERNRFASDLLVGARLSNATDLTLRGNVFRSPLQVGEGSSDSLIYDNRFDATDAAVDRNVVFGPLVGEPSDPPASNAWNVSPRPGENVVGGDTVAGNYYVAPDGTGFSRTCDDADADGLCDSPNRLAENNVDALPLAEPTNRTGAPGETDGSNATNVTTYQVDFAAGEPIENLSADRLYAQQDRLMRFAFGSVDEGITERDTAWPNATIRECVDYGHIRERANGTASVTFTLAANCSGVTLTLATYSMPGSEFSPSTVDQQVLLNATTRTYGPGEHTIAVDLPDGNASDD